MKGGLLNYIEGDWVSNGKWLLHRYFVDWPVLCKPSSRRLRSFVSLNIPLSAAFDENLRSCHGNRSRNNRLCGANDLVVILHRIQ